MISADDIIGERHAYQAIEALLRQELPRIKGRSPGDAVIVDAADQMQLAQPIQGIHPGRSGESSLEYLLNDMATIPPERGIFLKTTWRMHPDVCRFISDAVYDSRLEPEMANSVQRLILGRDAHPLLKPTGIRFVAADHDACSQRSAEEAGIVSELYRNLLKQRYKDKKGKTHRIPLLTTDRNTQSR